MKVAIFADIHGNLPALKVIIDDIKNKKIDKTICLGDTICLGPWVNECLDLLRENNIEMVLGNHELYITKGTYIDDEMTEEEIKHHEYIKNIITKDNLDFLNKCPMIIKDKVGNINISYQHFLFNPDLNDPYPYESTSLIKNTLIKDIFNYVDADITFIGHEHKDFLVEFNNKKLCDVGSSGCRSDDITFYTLLGIENDNIKLERVTLNYDRKAFEDEINNNNYPDRDNVKKIFFGM